VLKLFTRKKEKGGRGGISVCRLDGGAFALSKSGDDGDAPTTRQYRETIGAIGPKGARGENDINQKEEEQTMFRANRKAMKGVFEKET